MSLPCAFSWFGIALQRPDYPATSHIRVCRRFRGITSGNFAKARKVGVDSACRPISSVGFTQLSWVIVETARSWLAGWSVFPAAP
jgi:hypothetical protein